MLKLKNPVLVLGTLISTMAYSQITVGGTAHYKCDVTFHVDQMTGEEESLVSTLKCDEPDRTHFAFRIINGYVIQAAISLQTSADKDHKHTALLETSVYRNSDSLYNDLGDKIKAEMFGVDSAKYQEQVVGEKKTQSFGVLEGALPEKFELSNVVPLPPYETVKRVFIRALCQHTGTDPVLTFKNKREYLESKPTEHGFLDREYDRDQQP